MKEVMRLSEEALEKINGGQLKNNYEDIMRIVLGMYKTQYDDYQPLLDAFKENWNPNCVNSHLRIINTLTTDYSEEDYKKIEEFVINNWDKV